MAQNTRRRRRNPKSAWEAIREAARTRLANDGPEGPSLSEVAHLAGVNRGTAYQHFETREKLIKATAEWVSDKLFRSVFGDPATLGERRVEQVDVADLTDQLANFAMDNPELCQVWLLQAYRFAQECLRVCMYGSLRPEHYPGIAKRLKSASSPPVKRSAKPRDQPEIPELSLTVVRQYLFAEIDVTGPSSSPSAGNPGRSST